MRPKPKRNSRLKQSGKTRKNRRIQSQRRFVPVAQKWLSRAFSTIAILVRTAYFQVVALGVKCGQKTRSKISAWHLRTKIKKGCQDALCFLRAQVWPIVKRWFRWLSETLRAACSQSNRAQCLVMWKTWVLNVRNFCCRFKTRQAWRDELKSLNIRNFYGFFSPRRVRLESPKKHAIHTLMISFLLIGMAAGALAAGATVKNRYGVVDDTAQEQQYRNERDPQSNWLDAAVVPKPLGKQNHPAEN